MSTDYSPSDVMDRESRSNRYYRNAVERHWDPDEIDLTEDLETLTALAKRDEEPLTEQGLRAMQAGVANFGAGEDAVTEDLAPLAVVLEDIDDQMFVTTQMYEEAKHADFFDRYWREVYHELEAEMGWERSNPRDDEWFNESYIEIFDRNRKAMYRLLEADTPDNRAIAYCHYHLVLEGIAAQTGYYGFQRNYGGEFDDLPHLPGLVEGFSKIRSDEGRHVGFGMSQLKKLIREEGVDPELVDETVEELIPLVQAINTDDRYRTGEPSEQPGIGPDQLAEYTLSKHAERMEQIKDAAADIPDVDELVRIEGDD